MSGSDLYVEFWPDFSFTPRPNFYLDSVLLNNSPVTVIDYCGPQVCPQDSQGRYFNYSASTTFLVRIPISTSLATGSYTLSIKVDLGGAAKTTNLPLQINPTPSAVTPPTLPQIAVPNLATWQSTMLQLAAKWCPVPGSTLNMGDESEVWYYDGARVYYQIADYTGDSQWNACAVSIANQYRDRVVSKNGEMAGYEVFARGLRLAYERTGDSSYLNALKLLVTNSAYATLGGDAQQSYIRETAYILNAYIEAERAGQPRNPLMARSVDFLIADFNELFVSGNYQLNQTFFDGLAAEALINYYELTGDPRVIPTIKQMLDWMWNVGWNKSSNKLIYNPDPPGPKCPYDCGVYETEMINLIVPAFGWYYNLTGDPTYQQEGDTMFAHALDTDISYDGKIFSQNYRWSADYVSWRNSTSTPPPSTPACTYTLSSNTASVSASAGSASFQVTPSASTCAWTASSSASWATVSSGASTTGSGTVNVAYAANTANSTRTASLSIAGQAANITQAGTVSAPPQSCTYKLSPGAANVDANGGTVSFDVSASATSCQWTANTGSWATVSAGASGAGNGHVTYKVNANSSSQARKASLTIASQTATIAQAGEPPCSYTIAPATVTTGPAGGSISFQITTSTQDCTWTAVSGASWIASSGLTSGKGNGSVGYVVAQDQSTQARASTISVAGQTAAVNQNGVVCAYTLTPSTASIPAAGGSVSLSLTANAQDCSWTASSGSSWLGTSNTNGRGNGPVGFNAAANTSTQARSTSVTVADQTATITQPGTNNCSISVLPSSASVGVSGGPLTLQVSATTSDCAWTATSNVSWITVSGNSSGQGSGQATYSVASNPSSQPRTGTLTIGGQPVTVTQSNTSCSYLITPGTTTVSSSGGTINLQISTSTDDCAWTASSPTSWISVSGTAAGQGAGQVSYTVGQNGAMQARTGTITIGGQNATVQQGALSCNYSVSPGSAELSLAGGSVAFQVTTSDPACPWGVNTLDNWLTVASGAPGIGSGTVNFAAGINPANQQRNAAVTVAGIAVTVSQDANPCTYNVTPGTASVNAPGGTLILNLTTSDNSCPWTVASGATWVANTGSGTAQGNATLIFTVAANNTGQTRSTNLTIGGQTVAVTQTATSCTFAFNAGLNFSLDTRGGTVPIEMTASDSSCQWSALSDSRWLIYSATSGNSGLIPVQGGVDGSGSANLVFVVDPHKGKTTRTATIQIAGHTAVITQAGTGDDQ